MATARVDVETPLEASLPMTLDRHNSSTSVLIAGAFIAIAATVLLAPFSLLMASAANDPASFLMTVQQPAIALQLGLAFFTGVAFVALPLRRLLRRSMQPRRIVISGDRVAATNHRDGAPAWSEPLSAYRGIAHHIRTSLSGAQHEIVLVHPDATKSIVLTSADRIDQPQIDAMAALLDVCEVPARTLYQGRRSRLFSDQPAGALKAVTI
ncbi:MAG: hypothetical protein ABL904_12740 [Hyphomicrobiaceae bacterium]